ncbi:hypothetical protein ACFQ71_07020 [Streptomyces sp. NPDC056534]|uniref:hypothetical protein n=1 Tax=Streptomyces sp. NPDC056534 TaxID=3345857 RepID=UPI00367B4FFA
MTSNLSTIALRLDRAVHRLHKEANAKAVFLIGRYGQPLATAGETEMIDMTSLEPLRAGNAEGVDRPAKLMSEGEFSVLSPEEPLGNIHVSFPAKLAILVVFFDDRSSEDLVRQQVKTANLDSEEGPGLEMQLQRLELAVKPGVAPVEMTKDELNPLFGQ